jgi:hypothetical protein
MEREIAFNAADAGNQAVLKYLKSSGAHSDLTDVLLSALKPLGDVQIFFTGIPDSGCVTISTMGIIIAFGMGTQTIAFRVSKEMRSVAAATGGTAIPECGEDWYYFQPFRTNWPKTDFEFWALRAYRYVREK